MRVNVVKRSATNTYRVKVTSQDETGRWVTTWVRGSFRTEQEALAYKQEISANAERNNIQRLEAGTVAAYLHDWLEVRRAMGKIEASSASSYRTMLKRVTAHIGDLPLATLTANDIQTAYARIIQEKGVTAASTSHRVFLTAIRDAVKSGRLLADPFNRVQPPRAKKVRKVSTLTAEQVHAFLEPHRGTALGLFIELLAVSGMRRGEACALKWADFDFVRSRVRIERNFAIAGKTSYLKEPKSEAGRRTVSLPPETMARFAERRGQPEEFVFPCPNPRVWSRRVDKALARAGLGQFTTHDIRHAHATYLLKHTPNPKLVSKRLGHSDIKITLGIYAHVFEGDDDELGGLAGGLIGKE